MIEASKKDDDLILNKVLYIYYLFYFCKNKKNKVQALIDFGNKINVMVSAYAIKLDFKTCRINVGNQKIDFSIFNIFEIILAGF